MLLEIEKVDQLVIRRTGATKMNGSSLRLTARLLVRLRIHSKAHLDHALDTNLLGYLLGLVLCPIA
jgi:hypothetical protein